MWPIETTMAVSRLVYAGLYERFPDLKVIIHHAGGMIPMMEGRLENGLKLYGTRTAPELKDMVESPVKDKRQIDYFRKFYADCATFGSQAAIECAINFLWDRAWYLPATCPLIRRTEPVTSSGRCGMWRICPFRRNRRRISCIETRSGF